MALFIDVEVSPEVRADASLCAKLAEVCPVDIFEIRDGALEIQAENLDECTLCDLCLQAAPGGGVRVVKLYEG